MKAGPGAVPDRRRYLRRLDSLWVAASLLSGCGDGAPPVVIDEPSRREPPLLASEVQAAAVPRTLIDPVFVLTSHGGAPAEMRLASVGCGCYALTLDGRELQVGDQWSLTAGAPAEIRFTVQPSLRPGEMVYDAELEARCDRQTLRLPIHCVVTTLADVAITPDVITHRVGQTGSSGGRHSVHIRRTYRDAATAGAEPVCPGLPDAIRLSEWSCTLAGREEAPGLWIDEWRGMLLVDENAPGELPSGPVPVSLEFPATAGRSVHGELTLLFAHDGGIEAPRELHFGRLRAGESRTRRCVLRSRDGVPFRVTGVESEQAMVTVAIDHDDSSAEHWLDLLLSPADTAIESDTIHCRTDHPAAPQVQIVLVWRSVGEVVELSP